MNLSGRPDLPLFGASTVQSPSRDRNGGTRWANKKT
jgi:hypothetical protein